MPEGRVISSDVAAGDEATATGADRHRGLERPATRVGARRARCRGRRCRCAARRQLRYRRRRGGLRHRSRRHGAPPGPAPGSRAVLGSTVTLTVARAPEWGTTWSQSGSGSYDSGDDRGHGPAGQVADRRRAAPALSHLRLRLGDVLVGGHGGREHSARLGRLGRGRSAQRRRLVPAPRAPARQRHAGRCASSSSGSPAS